MSKILYTMSVILLITFFLILTSHRCHFVSVSCVSVANLDMSLMLLWACMLSSHFSPQNVSTVTLRTVTGSRQCGATPGEKTTANKGQLIKSNRLLTSRFNNAKKKVSWWFPDTVVVQYKSFISHCEHNHSVFYKYHKYTVLSTSKETWAVSLE